MYEAEEGESRWAALKRRNQTVVQEREDLREVISWLVARPEQDALQAFHRIRSMDYGELLEAARQSRDNHGGTATQLVPSPTEQRLPSIRALIDVSGMDQPHGERSTRPGMAPSLPSEGSVESYSSNYSAPDPSQQATR